MSSVTADNNIQYNRSKLWQIGLFTFNNTATNIYLFTLGFLSYYAAGIAGLAVLLVSSILGAIRIFDGLIDPFIGVLIDKLESRFGKYRPLILIGNALLALSYLLIFSTHELPTAGRVAFLVVALLIHKVGYSLQNSVTKAAQTVLTNDPKQRPLYAIFDGVYNIGVWTGGQIWVSTYLIGKYGDFTLDLFVELSSYAMVISGILTILAIIGIWKKDRKEFYGLGEDTVETRFRDYWKVIKGNRPLQMLTLSAASDKIASQTFKQSVVVVMLFGIILGNYQLSGTLSAIKIIPELIVVFAITAFATRKGLKKVYVSSVWIAVVSFIGMGATLLLVNDTTSISLSNMGLGTMAFILFYYLAIIFVGMPTTLVVPMIADVSDYETGKSGRYVAGMMGNIFSMVDQLVSSLAPIIVGIVVAMIGFKDQFPTVKDALTPELFTATLVLATVIPIFFLCISLTCMKFYKLDKKKMEEVQEKISDMKHSSKAGKEEKAVKDSEIVL